MGQLCDGSYGSWITKDDPFPSLFYILTGVQSSCSISWAKWFGMAQIDLFWVIALYEVITVRFYGWKKWKKNHRLIEKKWWFELWFLDSFVPFQYNIACYNRRYCRLQQAHLLLQQPPQLSLKLLRQQWTIPPCIHLERLFVFEWISLWCPIMLCAFN